MRNYGFDCKKEQGTALIATLMFLIVLGVLSTALVFTVQNEMRASTAYKYSQQALYVANAGVQKAVQWYAHSYNPHLPSSDYDATTRPVRFAGSDVLLAGQPGATSAYPEAPVITTFSSQFRDISMQANANNSGVYGLNASLLRYKPANFINPATFITFPSAIERWQLKSVGYWGTIANPLGIAQITAVIENSGNALFDRALWGIDLIDLGGTTLIDSYDPRRGVWNATTNAGDLGSIGSNGTVEVGGTADVHGDMAYGPSGSYSITGSAQVTGDRIHLAEPRYFPPIPSFSVGATNITVNPGNSQSITQGAFGSITVRGTLTLAPGTYYIDSLSVTSNGQLDISDSTTLFVKSALDMEGQGVMNTSWDPTKLTVYYSGTSQMKMTGGSQTYVEVYAPNADLQLNGGLDFNGSFIGKTVSVTGGPQVHFSEGCLGDHLLQRPFRIITWSQDSY